MLKTPGRKRASYGRRYFSLKVWRRKQNFTRRTIFLHIAFMKRRFPTRRFHYPASAMRRFSLFLPFASVGRPFPAGYFQYPDSRWQRPDAGWQRLDSGSQRPDNRQSKFTQRKTTP